MPKYLEPLVFRTGMTSRALSSFNPEPQAKANQQIRPLRLRVKRRDYWATHLVSRFAPRLIHTIWWRYHEGYRNGEYALVTPRHNDFRAQRNAIEKLLRRLQEDWRDCRVTIIFAPIPEGCTAATQSHALCHLGLIRREVVFRETVVCPTCSRSLQGSHAPHHQIPLSRQHSLPR